MSTINGIITFLLFVVICLLFVLVAEKASITSQVEDSYLRGYSDGANQVFKEVCNYFGAEYKPLVTEKDLKLKK